MDGLALRLGIKINHAGNSQGEQRIGSRYFVDGWALIPDAQGEAFQLHCFEFYGCWLVVLFIDNCEMHYILVYAIALFYSFSLKRYHGCCLCYPSDFKMRGTTAVELYRRTKDREQFLLDHGVVELTTVWECVYKQQCRANPQPLGRYCAPSTLRRKMGVLRPRDGLR